MKAIFNLFHLTANRQGDKIVNSHLQDFYHWYHVAGMGFKSRNDPPISYADL